MRFKERAPPYYTTNFGTAITTSGIQAGTKVGGAVGLWFLETVISSPLFSTIAVDAVAGTWDLGYVPWILKQIGEVKSPQFKF